MNEKKFRQLTVTFEMKENIVFTSCREYLMGFKKEIGFRYAEVYGDLNILTSVLNIFFKCV